MAYSSATLKPGDKLPPRGPARLTKTVKEVVLTVFNKAQEDPVINLMAFAKKYPRDFYAIAARLIPTEITGNLKKVINVNVTNGNEQAQIEDAKVIHINGEIVQEDILSNEEDNFFDI